MHISPAPLNPPSSPDQPQSTSGSSQTTLYDAAAHHRQKMDEVRAIMLESGTYLGDVKFREKGILTWERIGRDDCLVTKQSVEACNVAHKEYVSSLVEPHDADVAQDGPPSGPNLEHDMVELSIVVKITPEDFWMVSCGMWKGPTSMCQSFADMKLTCTGIAPDDGIFRDDFKTVLDNLGWVMKQKETPDHPEKRGLLIPRGTSSKIKFRHVLFEATAGTSTNEADDDGDDLGDEFKIKNWPAVHVAARDALRDMVNTHRVNPIPAYDVHGTLLPPSTYRSALEGSVARIHFNLRHWAFPATSSSKASNTFVADITYMRVLIPPKVNVTSPRKRKVSRKDSHAQGTPSPKKIRG
ncbi:hypothetical protein NLJ89_g3949 [Agrocybe chaxingu]|uniref:Uncharacterized protein n=1 Tax=Agrocybe chaxingu TaxID=84603 RepID=A0A9W8K402_9AGAR|nr:hypothetical protein NLJ89_g3949 [Agrocybe chaxingu]